MIEKKWFKGILYALYTIACAFSGYVIYYAAKNGTLYSSIFDNFKVKAIILGVPMVFGLILDLIRRYYNMSYMEWAAFSTSIGAPIACLLIGRIILGSLGEATVIDVFGLFSLKHTTIYILTYAISVAITYLTGMLCIWISVDDRPQKSYSPSYPTTTYTPPSTTDYSNCGPGGMPIEQGPNYIPHYDIEPGTMCND